MALPGLLWLPTCESTNDEARLRWDDASVRAVATDAQTGGRGRRGRTWFSPPGCGVYLSVLVRDRVRPQDAPALPLLAGVVAADLCRDLGAAPVLKWPNDVLDARPPGGKLCGVLCESRVAGDVLTAIVGVGLNLRAPPGGYPPDVPAAALGVYLPAREVAERLCAALLAAVEALPPRGVDPFPGVVSAWRARGPALGTPLRSGGVVGRYAGLAPDGALLLAVEAGPPVRIDAGEVELVAPLPPAHR